MKTGNHFGTEGAISLSEMLKVNTSLKNVYLMSNKINIYSNHFTNEEKTFCWKDNGIGGDGVSALKAAWGTRSGELKLYD